MSNDYPPPPPPPPGQGGTPGGGYEGMGAMPGAVEQPGGPVTQPASIAQAVKLMYVGAALSLLSILVGLLARNELRKAVEDASAKQATPMSPSQVDAAVTLGMVSAVVAGLIGVALWLWMARANGRGRSWARIVATVLWVIQLISLLASFVRPTAGLATILGVVTVVLGGYIVFLLGKKESSAFYAAQSAPRY